MLTAAAPAASPQPARVGPPAPTGRRAAWTEDMMSDPKEAILAVQTVRNSVTGVSILSAVLAALASALLNIITDPAKLAQARAGWSG